MKPISWTQERELALHTGSGDTYVKVRGGWMLASDYVEEGGRVETFENFELEEYGKMTNAQLQAHFG